MFANQSTVVNVKGKEIKIHAISIGAVSVKTKFRETSKKGLFAKLDFIFDKRFTEWMPIWVWVIEHPEGIYIIDTGVNANINNPNYFNSSGVFANWLNTTMFRFTIIREQEIDKQLLNLQINSQDVRAIILTHLHLDHVDGLKHFPNIKIIVNKIEWENPFGDLPKLYPNWFKPELIELKEGYQNFDNAFYITGSKDLIAIHSPGHTHGNISIILTTDDCNIIFVGDVCYDQNQIISDKYSGVNVNYSLARDTYNKLREFSKTKKLVFLPSHDREAATRLKGLVPMKSLTL
jgi:N-acyl homoserine lactone hydrolase